VSAACVASDFRTMPPATSGGALARPALRAQHSAKTADRVADLIAEPATMMPAEWPFLMPVIVYIDRSKPQIKN
jgi:hypothetical protein